jgi:sirohydrochlorin cobaltochelatase
MPASISRAALVLFAHGARDPEWSAPFRNVQHRVAARCPTLTVELAFLELMPPALEEVLERLAAAGHTRITIAPLFMAQGGHLKQDLPRLLAELRRRHPAIVLDLLPPVGEAEPVLEAISDWLVNAAQR